MDAREKDIEKLKDYKYGFTTDIENIKAPKGLNEDVIKFISNIKKEPQCITQPYLTKPPYQYKSKPMSQDRSLGAIWYNRRRTSHLV